MPDPVRITPGGLVYRVLNRGVGAVFMQRLTVTLVTRWQRLKHQAGYGFEYPGQYQLFPVEKAEYFYQVVRSVERNPLRANLMSSVDGWRWSSLWRHPHGNRDLKQPFASWPVSQPRNWLAHVEQPLSDADIEALRGSVSKETPWGDAAWKLRTAKLLRLESTLHPGGRPKKNI